MHFVNDLALGDIETTARLFAEKSANETEVFTPLEHETYNK